MKASMTTNTPITFWAVEWHSRNRLDGDQRYLIWDNRVELFRTRRECRAAIDERFGYIRERADLRGEPHGWFPPRAVRVSVVAA